MKAKIFSGIKLFIFLCIGLFFFWLAFRGQNIDAIFETFKHANYWWLIPSLLFALISNVSRAQRWNMLILPIGYRPKLVNTFGAVMTGYLANLAVPRIGEITRCTVLNQYEKIPVQSLIGTVVAERLIDMLSLIIILTLVVLAQFELLSTFVMHNFLQPVGEKISGYMSKGFLFYLIAFIIIAVTVFIIWRFVIHFRSTKIYLRLKELMIGFVEGLNTVRRLKSKGWFIFHTVFLWFCYTMMSYFCFLCFDFSSHMNMLQAITAMIFGGLGFVVPVQGGIGAYHYIVTQTMMVYGLSQQDGLSFATICHGAQTMAVIVFGAVSFFILPFLNRTYKPKTNEPA